MGLLSRKNQPPSADQIEASAHAVIETVKKTEFDPKTTLIIGGSALALAGVRPAGDVDLIVPAYAHEAIRRNPPYRTPGGLRLRFKSNSVRPIFETYGKLPRDIMHVDLITPERSYGNDEKFMSQLPQYDRVEGFRFLPPGLVLAHKLKSTERNRSKDQADIVLIRKHLEEQRRRGK